jgi:hypothetical protein
MNQIIRIFIFTYLSLFFTGCQSKSQLNQFKPPLIADTLPKTKELRKAFEINISYPAIEAIRPFGDTCFLNTRAYNLWDTSVARNVEQRADGLQFLVDTTQDVTIKYYKDEGVIGIDDPSQVYTKGYPCFIYNETSQIKWLMMQDQSVIVIQEALDSNYSWKPIQIWNWSWCGNSYYRAFLKPNHYLMFKIPLYAGDFYTDIRLKLYSRDAIYYSNEYKGFINLKQFNLPKELMDEKGKPGFNLSFLSN